MKTNQPTEQEGAACSFGGCMLPASEPVRFYSRAEILHEVAISHLRDDWDGYSFHEDCFKRWVKSWRK